MDFIVNNRLSFSVFSLLISILITYFWIISREKAKANNHNNTGLIYLSLTFFLYFLVGFLSYLEPLTVDSEVPVSFYMISILANLCLLTSLSFFSIQTWKIDDFVNTSYWRNGIKYFGFGLILFINILEDKSYLEYLDLALTVLAFLALGFFVSRYFLKRELKFLALVSACYFGGSIFIQTTLPGVLSEGKFVHLNTVVLVPGMIMAVLILSYTFSWINELNFYELSSIWVEEKETDAPNSTPSNKLTHEIDKDAWVEKIAMDQIEEVIQEIIIYKKHKSQNLEKVLILAARNTRNNNNQMKGIIPHEEYQLNRNQVSNGLIKMISKK